MNAYKLLKSNIELFYYFMFSIDLSYPINKDTNKLALKQDIKKLLAIYPSCKVYAEDVGPFGKEHSRRYYSIACIVTSKQELIKLIQETTKLPYVFVNFINIYQDSHDNDPLRIYTSITEMRFMSPLTRRRYEKTIEKLDKEIKEIYKICSEI